MIPRLRPLALLALATLATPAGAQEPVDPPAPPPSDHDLVTRLDELEDEVSELRRQLADGAGGAPAGAPATASGDIDAKLFGYIKLDAAYDSARTSVGNFARWVESEELSRDDNQFNMTAKETRLGLELIGPPEGAMQTSGLVEIDFYGSGSENRPEPYLRHAYVEIAWPDRRLELLAGQTWDVISPRVMPTVNYTVGWWQGNIGYRRPQIRLTKSLRVSDDKDLSLAVALSRTITGRTQGFAPEGDTGADAGFPTVQARVGLGSSAPGGGVAELGLSGHFGEEEMDLTAAGGKVRADSWSLNLDARVRLDERWVLQGELFSGQDLDSYLGGVGQGINLTTGREIASHGGWVAATVNASELWDVNFGLAIEDPEDDELVAGDRSRNQVYFANAWRRVGAHLQLALELSYLETDYVDLSTGDSVRAQFALVYRF